MIYADEVQLVLAVEQSLVIVDKPSNTPPILAGFQGVPGQPGAGITPITATAASALTWPTVVAVVNGLAHSADPTSSSDMSALLAITTGAAAAGASVQVQTQFVHSESMWNWSPGRVYLALTGGALTQNPDPSGAVLEVGRAINPTTIEFGIVPAILR